MAVTLQQTEAMPESYPDLGSPSHLSAAAAALGEVVVWQRIEAYVAHRWSERAVTWIVEGPGEWIPPLAPTVIATVEVWKDGTWTEVLDLSSTACGGLFLTAAGPYRISGVVGGGGPSIEPPEAVLEAFKRLAEYMATPAGKPGVTRRSDDIGGALSTSYSRSATWRAEALQNSGAADLLRPYRRVS